MIYALHDRKVIRPKAVMAPHEAANIRQKAIDRLNRFRYWANGVPPEKKALERFLEQMKKRREQQQFYESLLQENWSRTSLFSDHADSPGISKPYRRK
jgi:hypothetical protein